MIQVFPSTVGKEANLLCNNNCTLEASIFFADALARSSSDGDGDKNWRGCGTYGRLLEFVGMRCSEKTLKNKIKFCNIIKPNLKVDFYESLMIHVS